MILEETNIGSSKPFLSTVVLPEQVRQVRGANIGIFHYSKNNECNDKLQVMGHSPEVKPRAASLRARFQVEKMGMSVMLRSHH